MKDEGKGVGDFFVSIADCLQKCTAEPQCKSVAFCASFSIPEGGCHLKDKVISSSETAKSATSWNTRCKTYFKPVCQYGAFGNCSKSCDGGTQTRSVSAGSDSSCPAPETRTCNTQRCPPVCQYGDFGRCSKRCNGGTQTRSVPAGQDSRCAPPESKKCNEHTCPGKCVCRMGYDGLKNCGGFWQGWAGLGWDCHKHGNRGGCEGQRNIANKQFCVWNEESSNWR